MAHYLGLHYTTGNHAVALRLASGEGSNGQRLDLIKSGQDTDNVSFRVSSLSDSCDRTVPYIMHHVTRTLGLGLPPANGYCH